MVTAIIKFFSDAFTWYTFGTVIVAFLVLNKAILNAYVAHRLCRIIHVRTTIAGYVSALMLVVIVCVLTGDLVLDWIDAPRWWWQASFGIYLVAAYSFVHGFYVKLVLPVTALTKQITEEIEAELVTKEE